MSEKAVIFDIQHFSVSDGPGIRTTVFFKGCPLRCLWCHNPECFSENALSENAEKLYTPDSLLEEILPEKELFEISGGGVTLSGGECLTQPDFCEVFLALCRKNGINTAIDTSGYADESVFKRVAPYTDLFLYDIKAINEETHIKCTGRSNKLILSNLRYLDGIGAEIEIRVPYIPGWNDSEVPEIASFLRTLSTKHAVRVLPYHDIAASKYERLGLPYSFSAALPSPREISEAKCLLNNIF